MSNTPATHKITPAQKKITDRLAAGNVIFFVSDAWTVIAPDSQTWCQRVNVSSVRALQSAGLLVPSTDKYGRPCFTLAK